MTNDTITQSLEQLATNAPHGLLDEVLDAVGILADEFTLVDGPTGPAYVSWSRAGVTAYVPQAIVASPEEFAEQHPRPADYVEAPRAVLPVISTGHWRQASLENSPSTSMRWESSNARCWRSAPRSLLVRSAPTGGSQGRSGTRVRSAPWERRWGATRSRS